MNSKDLQERIARALWDHAVADGVRIIPDCRLLAAAVLPIVAEEVRKAKAEAWERGHVCGYSDAQDTARSITHGPHNPYTKTGGPR